MLSWLKRYIGAQAIRQLDGIEPVLAEKIKEAQAKASSIPPEQFAKEFVDSIQRFLCKKLDVPVSKIGLTEE